MAGMPAGLMPFKGNFHRTIRKAAAKPTMMALSKKVRIERVLFNQTARAVRITCAWPLKNVISVYNALL